MAVLVNIAAAGRLPDKPSGRGEGVLAVASAFANVPTVDAAFLVRLRVDGPGRSCTMGWCSVFFVTCLLAPLPGRGITTFSGTSSAAFSFSSTTARPFPFSTSQIVGHPTTPQVIPLNEQSSLCLPHSATQEKWIRCSLFRHVVTQYFLLSSLFWPKHISICVRVLRDCYRVRTNLSLSHGDNFWSYWPAIVINLLAKVHVSRWSFRRWLCHLR
jgi:hypothetical protein